MQRQFTATVFILDDAKTLLLFHKKHLKWMPPGGHVEANETPSDAAKREAFEETGVIVEFVTQENVWFDDSPNAKSIERPHHVLLETIPATAKEPAHEHIDFCYIARPISIEQAAEAHEMRWFSYEEVDNLKTGIDIFPDVQITAKQLLAHEKSNFCSGHRPACR